MWPLGNQKSKSEIKKEHLTVFVKLFNCEFLIAKVVKFWTTFLRGPKVAAGKSKIICQFL